MATLTQTAYFSRKIIKYGSFVLLGLIGLRIVYITVKPFIPVKPKPLPPPNIAFGKLPKISFPEVKNLPKLTYKLETISGFLPKLATQAKVYFMPTPASNYLAWDNTIAWAKNFGLTVKPAEVGKFGYLFTSETLPQTTLEVNVLTKNFTYLYDWKSDLLSTSPEKPPDENQSVTQASAFLQTVQSLPEDIDKTSASVVFLKNDSGNLIEAPYLEANFSKVNFFRKGEEEFKVLPPNPKNANINLIVSILKNNSQGVIEARYFHNQISWDRSATYPIKEAEAAWSQLIAGGGYIASLGNNPEGEITIRNAYLAYFDSNTPQTFLQPIIVFEGDKGFVAYVPAITDNLIVE